MKQHRPFFFSLRLPWVLACSALLLMGLSLGPLAPNFLVPGPAVDHAVDHAAILRGLDDATRAEGRELYASSCAACHGADGTASLPTARSFNADALKYGNDPYSMWQTITYGRGMMASQTWLTPEQRYHVIQYIRDELIRPHNPDQYFEVTEAYLAGLPRAEAGEVESLERAAAEGSQQAGQDWVQHHPGAYGAAVYSQLEGRTSAALTVRLDGDVYLAYDLLRMRTVAAWQGALDVSETKFSRYRGEGKPRADGTPLDGLETWHWGYRGTLAALDEATSPRAPLPPEWLTYHGHYQHGEQVLLSYSILGREVLELPGAHALDGGIVLDHTLRIGPGAQARKLYVGSLGGRAGGRTGVYTPGEAVPAEVPRLGAADGTLALVSAGGGGRFTAAAVVGEAAGLTWEVDAENRLVLHVPALAGETTIRVLRYGGRGQRALGRFEQWAAAQRMAPVPALEALTRGGPRRWNEPVTTETRRDVVRAHYDPVYYEDADRDVPAKLVPIPPDYPYTVDEIALPFSNPWDAWMRPTALDFFDDGRLVLATYLGDVWVASGLDGEAVAWQRIATGLYEPMGVRVVDGQIYVTARDRIVRLHDRNGDGEADFYESFYADRDVSDFFHSFAFGLQTDSEGNFYYTKAGQYTNNAHPGDVMKVSPDGRRGETIAMGFRTPNGITVSPDDRVFVSDNQGSWMPANKISLIEPGGYYGYVPNLATRSWSPDGIPVDERGRSPLLDQVPVPDDFDRPVVWMPQELDNSPGGGTWSAEGWGPLGGRFIHTSFGKGWVYLVMLHEVEGVTQGAVVPLPFQFDAGLQRARVNPADGQIYVVGLTGWDDGFATRYGSLNRVRYRGGEGHLLTDAEVRPDGVALTFNTALGAAAARPEAYEVLQWNYKWQQRYGSDDWSLARPGEQGRDTVAVAAVRLEDGGRTALVEVPGIGPVDQMRIRFDVPTADGARIRETVYLTIRR